jgi:hypothetical protein
VTSKAPRRSYPPEAPSPRMDTNRDFQSRDIQSRDISTSGSDYPPSRYEDVKGGEIMTVMAFATPREVPQVPPMPQPPNVGGSVAATMTSASFGASFGAAQATGFGGVPIQGQLFPPLRTVAAPASIAPPLREVKKANSIKNRGKLEISGPILSEGGDQNPLNKIATIDLATAAANDRERRETAWKEMTQKAVNLDRDSSLIAKRPAPQPPSMSPEEAMKRAQSFKRKEVASGGLSPGNPLRSQPLDLEPEPMPVPVATATTTSAQLSPGVEEIRRRSPRQPPQPFQETQSSPKMPSPKMPSQKKVPPVRPRRPDESDDLNAPKPPPPPEPTSPVVSAPKTPVQQETTLPQEKRSPPRRPPRPESLDIDQEPQVTKPAPKQLMGLNPQVRNLQRKVTPPKRAQKPGPMSPVREEAPLPLLQPFPVKLVEPATAAALPPAPQPPRLPSPPQLPRSASPQVPAILEQFPPPPPPPAAPQPSAAAALANPRMSAFPVMPKRGASPPIPAPPPPPPEPKIEMSSEAPDVRMSILPRNNSVRANIRPSRRRPPSVEDAPEPEIKPVQRRPTAGLPGNPRAMSMKIGADPRVTREQTVMFVNRIQYDDPVGVQNIIDGAASKVALKTAKSPAEALKSSESVMHRPRPIPRKPEPSTSPKTPKGHQRNRSGGSVGSRKSNILHSTPGSPTQLPPLPPPPKSAGNPLRPLPNDTKSMTFDEKMAIFFPAPPSSSSPTSASRLKRRNSPPPQIPPLPADFFDMEDAKSAATSKTSVRTQSILEVTDIPKPPAVGRNQSQLSSDSYAVADEVGRTWLPDLRPEQSLNVPTTNGDAKRMSSPLLPPNVDEMSDSTESRTHDDWASVHSPALAVTLQTRQVAKALDIPGRDSDGKEVMTIMLDNSYDDDAESMLGRSDSYRARQWHRRVGDDCPTFSDRKAKTRSRKMVPPTPLLLRTNSSKNAVVFRTAEPSPVESPSLALEEIQHQLSKLDRPKKAMNDRDSMDSDKRMTLLQNLEREMDMQEGHWQEMREDIRDSISTVKTSPRRDSVADGSALRRAPSKEMMGIAGSNLAADRRLRKQRTRADSISKEAHAEYRDNQGRLVANVHASRAKLNVMSVPKMALGSPTPPDTDESDNEGMDSRVLTGLNGKKPSPPETKRDSFDGRLWNKPSPITELPTPSTGMLWTPGVKPSPSTEQALVVGLPGTDIGPNRKNAAVIAKRRSIEDPANIQSKDLWKKSEGATKTRSANGLWKNGPAPGAKAATKDPKPQDVKKSKDKEKDQKPPRPVTQRPPRRSRRVTLLPDIVESPEPLPDNRGTLGIFQFPWGERSDTATVNARPGTMFMAMPGTMTTGGPAINAALEARSKQLEAHEYSSSFFDDYDEESDAELNRDEDSDDGFDETTLWEIASLLQTDQVPSKGSLLPSTTRIKFTGESSIVDDYMVETELPSDSEESGEEQNGDVIIKLDTDAFPMPPRQSSLWADRSRNASSAEPAAPATPRSNGWSWQKLMPSQWSNTILSEAENEASLLWSSDVSTAAAMHMWVASDGFRYPEPTGLFAVDSRRAKADFRTTSLEPAALDMPRKPRVNCEPLPKLESAAMWRAARRASTEWSWITMSMAPRSVERDVAISGAHGGESAWWESRPARSTSRRKPGANLPSSAPARQAKQDNAVPVRQQYRASIAFRADWAAALAEAIDLSYPNKRARHPATEAEWAAALEEALTQTAKNDVRRLHPVFAVTRLPTQPMASFHPVLTGYVTPALIMPPKTPTSRVPIRSVSDAGPRKSKPGASPGNRDSGILRQIHALEAEAGVMSVPPVPALPAERERSKPAQMTAPRPQLTRSRTMPSNRPAPFLWAKPLDASQFARTNENGKMWVPPPRKNSVPQAPVETVGEQEDPGLRRKRSKKEARDEAVVDRSEGITGQTMWRPNLGNETGRNWLDASVKSKTKGVVFRY